MDDIKEHPWIKTIAVVITVASVATLGIAMYGTLHKLRKRNPQKRKKRKAARAIKTIDASELEPNMVIITPLRYRDEDGRSHPLGQIWPDAPDTLVVDEWDWEEGTSKLVDPKTGGFLDLNINGYPKKFQVVAVRGGRA